MISIDISNDRIFAVHLSGRGVNMRVYGTKTIEFQTLVLDDEQVHNVEVFKDLLAESMEDFKSKEVAITFTSVPIVSDEVVVPFDKNRKNVIAMIKGKVFQTVSEEHFLMDYREVGTFEKNNVKMLKVVTSVLPRKLVETTYKVLKELKKEPELLYVAQESVLEVSNAFLKEKSHIIVNAWPNQVNLHLVNQPHSIITRTATISGADTMDILAQLSGNTSGGIEKEITDQVSKLTQYQQIKFSDVKLGAVYLTGPEASEVLRQKITDGRGFIQYYSGNDTVEVPVKLLSVQGNDLFSESEESNIYAVGAALEC